jgi:hypothetical protein
VASKGYGELECRGAREFDGGSSDNTIKGQLEPFLEFRAN